MVRRPAPLFRKSLPQRLAATLRALADRLHRPYPLPLRMMPEFQAVLALPGATRINWRALERGEVHIAYSATDAIWHDIDGNAGCIDLREHCRHLCLAARELAEHPVAGAWDAVAHNLQLAYALTDLFADTDMDGASGWCSPVADFEAVNGEVAAKHLAATIVFTFAWTAYECAVGSLTPGNGGRGARGRDLIAALPSDGPVFLRATLLHALSLDGETVNYDSPDMRRAVRQASIGAIAAEHLRQFRNALIHGDIAKPDPEDWGADATYVADNDDRLRRFHANTRLVLMLLQMLAAHDAGEGRELSAWLEEPGDARTELLRLHLAVDDHTSENYAFDWPGDGPSFQTPLSTVGFLGG